MQPSRLLLAGLIATLAGCSSSSSSTDSLDDATPVISTDNAETLLREVISMANDEALNEASARLDPVFVTVKGLIDQARIDGASSGNGLTYLYSDAINDGGAISEYSFSCDSGGTLVARAYYNDPINGAYVDRLVAASACSIDDAAYEGSAYKAVRFVRGTDVSTFENFSVEYANGDSLFIDGELIDTSPEGRGPITEISWTEASLLAVEGGETTRIDDYSSFRRSVVRSQIPGVADPSTVAQVSFSVTAPWTSGNALDVRVDLAYAEPTGSSNETGINSAQWQTGTLRVTANDGSGLTLTPNIEDSSTFSVAIDGDSTDPIILNWADGYQVQCAPDYQCP